MCTSTSSRKLPKKNGVQKGVISSETTFLKKRGLNHILEGNDFFKMCKKKVHLENLHDNLNEKKALSSSNSTVSMPWNFGVQKMPFFVFFPLFAFSWFFLIFLDFPFLAFLFWAVS